MTESNDSRTRSTTTPAESTDSQGATAARRAANPAHPTTSDVRRRYPLGYLFAGAGTVLAVLLVLVSINSFRDEANAREHTLARVEIAYAVARNQINAAGLTPAPGAPSLPILVGPEGITGNQGAPPIVQFDLPIPQEPTKKVHIVCKDSSGSGDYQNCTESVVPIPKSGSSTTT